MIYSAMPPKWGKPSLACNFSHSRVPTEGESVGCRAALLVQNPAQDVNLIAGNRWAGCERLPLGRPGERPQGFGAFTGLPSAGRSDEKPRRTRAGVRRSGGNGRCQGRRTSATTSRAKRNWT
jgi:hypothetical protein